MSGGIHPIREKSGLSWTKFSTEMYSIQTEVLLPCSQEQVFPFFADAYNLELLTPPWLRFRVVSRAIEMKTGSLIDYRLRLRGIPIRWQSEITVWDPPHRFVDRQLRGPYKTWIHEHRFEGKAGETKVIDNVRYDHPGGRWVNQLLVKRDLDKIFSYRKARLKEFFS